MTLCQSDTFNPCKIGQQLDDTCHKTSFCRKSGFFKACKFDELEKNLLNLRCGVLLSNEDQVCYHHEKVYLSRFQNLQKSCCDPFGIHKKRVRHKYCIARKSDIFLLNLMHLYRSLICGILKISFN